MPFFENLDDRSLDYLLREIFQEASFHSSFDQDIKILKGALERSYGIVRAHTILDKVMAAQASASLSVLNSGSVSLKDRKRPLIKKEFVLDIENTRNRYILQKEIERLGGTVMESLDVGEKKPFCIISDYHRVEMLEKPKKIKINAQLLSSLPMMLRRAIENDVRIKSYSSFQLCMINLKKRMKTERRVTQAPTKTLQVTVRQLSSPFIKLEDLAGEYAPSVKEFVKPSNFRPIYLGKFAGKSVFHKVSAEAIERRLKDNKEKSVKPSRPPRPRTQLCSGFCDICAQNCENLRMHYGSKEHQQRINQPGFYDEVDALCGSFTDDILVPNIPRLERRQASPLPLESSLSQWHSVSSFDDSSSMSVD